MDGVIVEQGFEEMTELWEVALTGSSSNFIFLTPAWQRIWWEEFGKGSQLQLMTIPVDSAVGIAPLMLTEGALSLIGNTDLFDYRDFIVPGGAEEEFFRPCWTAWSLSAGNPLRCPLSERVPQPWTYCLPLREKNGAIRCMSRGRQLAGHGLAEYLGRVRIEPFQEGPP